MPSCLQTRSFRLGPNFSLALLGLLVLGLPLAASSESDFEERLRFGQRIAGLYLSIGAADAHVFSIEADGEFVYMESAQFAGFSGGPAFGDEMGAWRRAGKRRLVATSLHLGYWQDGGEFTGTTVLRRSFKFAKGLRRITVQCTGMTYAPGVDPFAPSSEAESTFVCPERVFRRIEAGS